MYTYIVCVYFMQLRCCFEPYRIVDAESEAEEGAKGAAQGLHICFLRVWKYCLTRRDEDDSHAYVGKERKKKRRW
jgi:hypothetical protein